jgi:serine/threonine-protein kinase HipA
MSDRLHVHYQQHTIGELNLDPSAQMHFRYRAEWAELPGAFPISLSLPLDGSFTPQTSHCFFANLLPEANVRQQICKSLGISPSNDFQLLKAIGGDCAGALAITASCESNWSDSLPRYESVTEEQLALWSIGSPDAFSAITGQNEVRLSLAGAQDKLPVHLEDDRILIPTGHAPSTYILKFASPFYSHLPENECFITLLGAAVGLPVVDVHLRPTARARVAVIARYDRILFEGRYRRLHQEDFCQALGIGPSNKYEKEKGPNLKQCADVIRRHTSFPLVDLQKLLKWALFNLLVGNADAHGKNLSLLYDTQGAPSLAPFYDLVCTRNYKKISREMAMNLGGVFDPDLVGKQHLDKLAEDLSIRPKAAIQEASALIDQLSEALPQTADRFVERFGTSPVTERLPIIIRKQLRRMHLQLRNASTHGQVD